MAASEFLDWLGESQNFGCYPIWVCPFKNSPGVMESGHAAGGDGYLMNFGLWAPSTHNRRDFIAQNRRLEQKVHSLNGKKWLYAHAYYTEDEFWSIYDKKRYDKLRSQYNANYLPDLYQKVRVDLDVPDEQPGIVARVKNFL
ncbi:FAD binding domain protein [Aspergillus sclerotialis]|uniref:FAD binding domain protein n=1 Tax=Aspergillus sclerotialis TaxID=2070753 RepID=A0A3A2Z437_9EURO|nr:FAD binding domain protein [Aspergillus sclerotialis]